MTSHAELRHVCLHFTAPVHLGDQGIGNETSGMVLRSDTLFSALWIAWQQCFDEPLAVNGDVGEPLLTVSSAFPFVKDTCFFPRPMMPMPHGERTDEELQQDIRDKNLTKEVKKLRYIPETLFGKWVNGESFAVQDVEAMVARGKELDRAIKRTIRPRVALDRESQASSLFFYGETRFAPRAGLHFFARLRSDNWKRLEQALAWLGESGIGGKRSAGYGTFRPGYLDSPLPEAANPNAWLSLSLVLPGGGEACRADQYSLVSRMGWTEGSQGSTDWRHHRIAMFGEGSLFREPLRGQVADVRPFAEFPHPVYRNGLALLTGVRREVPPCGIK